MDMRQETRWLCENARALERFSGKWVLFCPDTGFVNKGASLSRLLRSAATTQVTDRPFVFHVPSKRELSLAYLAPRRR